MRLQVVDDDAVVAKPRVEKVGLGFASPPPQTVVDADPFAQEASVIKTLGGLNANTKRRISNDMKKFSRGDEGAKSKAITDEHLTGYLALDVIQPQHNFDHMARIYELSAPHYAAVKAKVANIVGLGFTLVESPTTRAYLDRISDDEEKLNKFRRKLQTGKDAMLEKLDTLNEEDTIIEVLSRVWTDYEVMGNGYLEIARIETGPRAGEIGYIGHIPATTIRVRRERDGYVQIIADKAVFFRHIGDTTPDPIGNDSNPNEIIHFKKYSPTDGYYGVSDVLAAMPAITANEYISRFNLDYFENKAVPRHVIVLKGAELSGSAEQAILEFFETGLKGKNHRSLYVPLPGDTTDEKVDFKIEPVEAGIQDQSFEKYKKTNLSEILMAHRVPVTKIGTPEGVNLAVARDADKTFKEQVCQPEQKILEKKLNKVIKEFTDVFVIKFNELTLTDADTQSKIDERRVKNKIEVPNEVRARDGLPGIKGGDKPLELKPQDSANATANRQRDADRSANASDSSGEARQPKGEGRAQE